ncbi:MAG: GDP/UDP-N,N'-diacetylbacillosamine 2-epimerase (hydrolyzing) [Elusimicrobia bacterium]|nr:GDP/UDP-N,N'-diacetylbacillosamine 2-epimerase (hydrolyzing) [Elusimicrobiota bacterium]
MRTIGVVTTSRADYGIYRPLLQKIKKSSSLKLSLFVSGTHLLARFGSTIRLIEADGFHAQEKIKVPMRSQTSRQVSESMGIATALFSKAYERSCPDILLVLGDRYEMHAATVAAVPFLIPIAHIAGGAVTEGAIDDGFRHSITKLSHIHFVETELYGRRIRQMGEEPWRVHVSGALSLDNFCSMSLLDWNFLRKKFHIPFQEKPVIVTYHPETKRLQNVGRDIDALLKALKRCALPVVFTAPNADTRSDVVRWRIKKFVHNNPRSCLVENFGSENYLNLLRHARAMVGNSSSGLVEAPSFSLPVVNVGQRQAGRLAPKNVITTDGSTEAIQQGILKALSTQFRARINRLKNPYGNGFAAEKIIRVLSRVKLDQNLLQKKFIDWV